MVVVLAVINDSLYQDALVVVGLAELINSLRSVTQIAAVFIIIHFAAHNPTVIDGFLHYFELTWRRIDDQQIFCEGNSGYGGSHSVLSSGPVHLAIVSINIVGQTTGNDVLSHRTARLLVRRLQQVVIVSALGAREGLERDVDVVILHTLIPERHVNASVEIFGGALYFVGISVGVQIC